MAEANNIFISWSGERSKHAAKFLRKWLRNVIHSARPWMSEKDIKSGSVSVNSIRTALAGAKAGIVCLTPECLKEPWLNFEAGGLLRTPEAETRVCTYLLAGLEPGQLEYPLAMFQARITDKEQTLALVQDINKYLDENPLTEAEMKEAFEKWWDDLKTVLETLPPPTAATPPARDQVAMTAEILDHLRAMRPEVCAALIIPGAEKPAASRRAPVPLCAPSDTQRDFTELSGVRASNPARRQMVRFACSSRCAQEASREENAVSLPS
jgi:hypothetical protein